MRGQKIRREHTQDRAGASESVNKREKEPDTEDARKHKRECKRKRKKEREGERESEFCVREEETGKETQTEVKKYKLYSQNSILKTTVCACMCGRVCVSEGEKERARSRGKERDCEGEMEEKVHVCRYSIAHIFIYDFLHTHTFVLISTGPG